MQKNKIQLNPKVVSNVFKVGDEKTPVVVIDNLVQDTHALVEHVCRNVDFDAERYTYYPGLRASIMDEYKDFVVAVIGEQLRRPFDVPQDYRLMMDSAYYSLATTPPEELLPAQCRPHADTAKPYYLAVMHYLGAGNHGGTGFFKHKPTGFERITADRLETYVAAVSEYEEQHGPQPQGYISETIGQYELAVAIGYKPNRVIIYPGNLLHSGLIKPETDLIPNPRLGRLTANIFLDFAPRRPG